MIKIRNFSQAAYDLVKIIFDALCMLHDHYLKPLQLKCIFFELLEYYGCNNIRYDRLTFEGWENSGQLGRVFLINTSIFFWL